METDKQNKTDFNENQTGINRRDFLTKTGLATAGAVAGSSFLMNAFGATVTVASKVTKNNLGAEKRKLGSLQVSPIGLGCMSMAGTYNPPQPKEDMIRIIRTAVEKGITFFDTAEVYGPLYSEEIVGEALAPFKNEVVIATKFGFDVSGGRLNANGTGGRNSKPAHIRQAVEGSLKRLRVEALDLCYLHRMDPEVPVEDIAGTVKDLIGEGKIKHFGMSEVSPETIRKAHAVQPVSAIQSEYSIMERNVEHHILPLCEELGIGFVPWGPVARGFLTGRFDKNYIAEKGNRRADIAYFKPEALEANIAMLNFIKDWAKRKDITPVQFALGWLQAQKPWIVSIPGTINPQHSLENIGASNVTFSPDELSKIRTAIERIPLVGVRKPDSSLKDQ